MSPSGSPASRSTRSTSRTAATPPADRRRSGTAAAHASSPSVSAPIAPVATTNCGEPSASAASAPAAGRTRTSASPARSPSSTPPPTGDRPVRRGRRRHPARQPDRPHAPSSRGSRASAVIGDGPHGTIEGDGSGDFDFYAIDDAAAGQLLTVDIDAVRQRRPARHRRRRARADRPDPRLQRRLAGARQLRPARAARRWRLLRGRGCVRLAADEPVRLRQRHRRPAWRAPTTSRCRSSSPRTSTSTASTCGPATCSAPRCKGSGRVVELIDPSGTLVIGSGVDLGADVYPDDSPLNVARQRRRSTTSPPSTGRTTCGSRAARASTRSTCASADRASSPTRQAAGRSSSSTSTAPFIEPGDVRRRDRRSILSPLADFLAGWGLTPADESAVIDAILARFTENVVAGSARPRWQRPASTSRSATAATTPTRWASRTSAAIVIGGTREQLGFDTVGLSPVDRPRQLRPRGDGVVLLDQASAPAGSGVRTINDFVTPGHRCDRPRRQHPRLRRLARGRPLPR